MYWELVEPPVGDCPAIELLPSSTEITVTRVESKYPDPPPPPPFCTGPLATWQRPPPPP